MPVTPLADWRDALVVRRGLFDRLFREPLERDAGRVARFDFCGDRELLELLLARRLVEALLRRAGALPLRRADPDLRAAGLVVWAIRAHLPQGCYIPCLG
jgi:hypothetical protein